MTPNNSVLTGTVRFVSRGLSRIALRVRVGQRTDIRVRMMPSDRLDLNAESGDRLLLTIPTEAIRLEADWFRRTAQRWNRWPGRVVLVRDGSSAQEVTVKLLGEDLTFVSRTPVLGLRRPPRCCDIVNVVIDPAAIQFSRTYSVREWPLNGLGAPVSLRGAITDVRVKTHGTLLSLKLGDTRALALLTDQSTDPILWKPGQSVAVTMSGYETSLSLWGR